MLSEIKQQMYSDCRIDFITPCIYSEKYRLTEIRLSVVVYASIYRLEGIA